MNERSQLSGSFFRSFLVVAGCLVGLLTCTFLCVLFIGQHYFPEAFANWEKGTEHINELLESDPTSILPIRLCWIAIAVNSVFSLIVGAVAYRLAPFGNVAHSGFLAVVVALFYLQASVSQESRLPDWVAVALMISSPLCIVLGGQIINRFVKRNDDADPTSGE